MTAIASAPPTLLAICGTDACGKDFYAHHLEQKGYMHVSAGDAIRAAARARGHTDPIPREILSKVGDALKAEYGPAPIVLSSLERYEQERGKFPAGLIISGLRRVPEIEALKAQGGFVLFIDAPFDLRYEWQKRRVGREIAETPEQFRSSSDIEYYGLTEAGKGGVYLQGVEALADIKVMNDGTATFLQSADDLLGVKS